MKSIPHNLQHHGLNVFHHENPVPKGAAQNEVQGFPESNTYIFGLPERPGFRSWTAFWRNLLVSLRFRLRLDATAMATSSCK